jgi:uncharacterized membrane protein YhiD involved in acid resistance
MQMNEQSRKTIEEVLALTNSKIPIMDFVIALLLTAILAYLLSLIFVRYGFTLSNRKAFGKNFILVSMTTMVIISIVKSSLALSLGLVGALSIVRFRSAVKEPEELLYLFLSIAIGLGLGANQVLITIIGCVLIFSVLISRKIFTKNYSEGMNMFITITSLDTENTDIKKIISILESNSLALDLKRLDIKSDVIEASFLIELNSNDQLTLIAENIKGYNKNISVSYIDNQGIY